MTTQENGNEMATTAEDRVAELAAHETQFVLESFDATDAWRWGTSWENAKAHVCRGAEVGG